MYTVTISLACYRGIFNLSPRSFLMSSTPMMGTFLPWTHAWSMVIKFVGSMNLSDG